MHSLLTNGGESRGGGPANTTPPGKMTVIKDCVYRQKERGTDGQINTERQRDRHRDRHRDRPRDRETDRQ